MVKVASMFCCCGDETQEPANPKSHSAGEHLVDFENDIPQTSAAIPEIILRNSDKSMIIRSTVFKASAIFCKS